MVGYRRVIVVMASAMALLALPVPGATEDVRPSDLPTLHGQFAPEAPGQMLIAMEAFLADEHFYVKYRVGSRVVFSGGQWARRIPADVMEPGKDFNGPYMLPLEYHQSDRWPRTFDESQRRRILDRSDWVAFRNLLIKSLLPMKSGVGIVLQFQSDDYFLYYDQAGNFHAVPIESKPVDYAIHTRLTFREFLQQGAPVMERFLTERGVDERPRHGLAAGRLRRTP